jgi:hypothetical protein
MEGLGQNDYILQIRDFAAEDVIDTLERLKLHREAVVGGVAAYRQPIIPPSDPQSDALAELATRGRRRRTWYICSPSCWRREIAPKSCVRS